MASTTEAHQLTEAHRLAQARLAAQSVQQLLASWHVLDLKQIDATLERWLLVTVPLVDAQRTKSARLAGNYLKTFRALELGSTSGFTPTLVEHVAPEAVATSLTVTGPYALRASLGRGKPFDDAVDSAAAGMARAGMRQVLGGGRDTINESVKSDKQALGWARATSGNACAFCAMTASRGAVYKSEDAAGFEAHDGCHCEPEPIYRADAALPPGSERYKQLWQEAKVGTDDPVNAFRRALSAA